MDDVVLLDTTIASAVWDLGDPSHQSVFQRISALGVDVVSICAVTVGEVLYGLQVSPCADPARHQAVKQALAAYRAWPIDHHTAEVFATLRGRLFERYSPRNARGRLTKKQPEELIDETSAKTLGIQENDLWIISVAVQYDLRFITSDRKLERILQIASEHLAYSRAEIWDRSTSD